MKIRSDFFPCILFSCAFGGMKQRPFKADWFHSSTRQCIWLWGPEIKAASWNHPQLQIMHGWDVQIGLICIFMSMLSSVGFFFPPVEHNRTFSKVWFSKLTVELTLLYFLLIPCFLTNFCCSTGMNGFLSSIERQQQRPVIINSWNLNCLRLRPVNTNP